MARYFFASLKTFLESDAGRPRHALLSGHDLERWLLKTAKAIAVSGSFSSGSERLSGAFSQDTCVIGMLDEPGLWPAGCGLYCVMRTGDLMVNTPRFQIAPWTDVEDRIVGLEIGILGFAFILLLEPPDEAKYPFLAGARYRPGRIAVAHPRSNSWLTLSWQDGLPHAPLHVQFVKHVARDGPHS